jgi:hypothetical protein
MSRDATTSWHVTCRWCTRSVAFTGLSAHGRRAVRPGRGRAPRRASSGATGARSGNSPCKPQSPQQAEHACFSLRRHPEPMPGLARRRGRRLLSHYGSSRTSRPRVRGEATCSRRARPRLVSQRPSIRGEKLAPLCDVASWRESLLWSTTWVWTSHLYLVAQASPHERSGPFISDFRLRDWNEERRSNLRLAPDVGRNIRSRMDSHGTPQTGI